MNKIILIALLVFSIPTFAISDDDNKSSGITKYPPKYTGANVDKILAKVKKASAQIDARSEFETKGQYQQRIDAVTKKFGRNEIVIVFSRKYIYTSYDPDTEILKVYSGGDQTNSLNLRSHDKTVGSYIGSNAYGAKTRIDQVHSYSLDLVYDQTPFNYAAYQAVSLGYMEIKVKPEVAKRLKGNIAVAYTMELEPPFFSKDRVEKGAPTYSDPVESTEFNEVIYVNYPTRIDVFEYNSGEILKTIEPVNMLTEWKEQQSAYMKCWGESDDKLLCKKPGIRFSIPEL